MSLVVIALCCSCHAPAASQAQATAVAPVDEGPPIQVDQVYVEERRDGRVVWSARAPQAQGSAQQANVTELTLHVNDAEEGPGGLSLRANTAELMLDAGEIVLHTLVGHDERGMTFDTELARFSRHSQTLICEDVVRLSAPLGELQAAAAHVSWAAGEADFSGPVTGRVLPAEPPPPPP